MKKSLFIGGLLLLLASCAQQKIAYNLDSVKVVPESQRLSQIVFSVQNFEDIRSSSEQNEALLQAKQATIKINKTNTCVNAEKLYKTPVGEQMTSLFASHLIAKKVFADVLVNQKEVADYYLTGKIKHFYGTQAYSSGAAIGAQFGLIGALATSNLKTKGTIIIELTDLCIYDNNDNLIAKVGDFKKEYEGEFPVDANCFCIFNNINQKLYAFNEDLAQVLWMEVTSNQEK
ncbi:MAG: hypothetical protein FWG84_06440 [Bacteroidales bacterium]|nr:hypothetical protein [Bacteroidales bacterium]